ncbi:MAG TPA: DUF3426 domain-containing protein [Casimicrobiaceae bacterium]|nr:DUF3426 domain-containing protein [Casimicrobiaceae bacterium]
MPDEKYTRCPGCATVFRVKPEQLALRAGQVRCGHCKTVFDGVAQAVSLAPPARVDRDEPPLDEAALGPPTVTLRDARSLEPAPPATTEPEPTAESAPTFEQAATTAEVPYEERFTPVVNPSSRRRRVIVYAAAIVVLVLLIFAQAIFHFRDAIAAHWPPARPMLQTFCDTAGCTIHPLRDAAMGYLSIEASDLQADPAHRGLLVLAATLRNRAAWALSYPYLELTLTDAQDRVVVRRALAPADYAGGTADLQRGIAPNGEAAIKIFIDASATTQAGYRLYMFYP